MLQRKPGLYEKLAAQAGMVNVDKLAIKEKRMIDAVKKVGKKLADKNK